MIPPSLSAAKVAVTADDKPSNRDAARRLASLVMLARQIDAMAGPHLPSVAQTLEMLEVKPAFQTTARRSGIDLDELREFFDDLSHLLRDRGAPPDSGGKSSEALPGLPGEDEEESE